MPLDEAPPAAVPATNDAGALPPPPPQDDEGRTGTITRYVANYVQAAAQHEALSEATASAFRRKLACAVPLNAMRDQLLALAPQAFGDWVEFDVLALTLLGDGGTQAGTSARDDLIERYRGAVGRQVEFVELLVERGLNVTNRLKVLSCARGGYMGIYNAVFRDAFLKENPEFGVEGGSLLPGFVEAFVSFLEKTHPDVRSFADAQRLRDEAEGYVPPVRVGHQNKPWTQDEDLVLRRLVEAPRRCRYINWAAIADGLGTGRSASAVEARWESITYLCSDDAEAHRALLEAERQRAAADVAAARLQAEEGLAAAVAAARLQAEEDVRAARHESDSQLEELQRENAQLAQREALLKELNRKRDEQLANDTAQREALLEDLKRDRILIQLHPSWRGAGSGLSGVYVQCKVERQYLTRNRYEKVGGGGFLCVAVGDMGPDPNDPDQKPNWKDFWFLSEDANPRTSGFAACCPTNGSECPFHISYFNAPDQYDGGNVVAVPASVVPVTTLPPPIAAAAPPAPAPAAEPFDDEETLDALRAKAKAPAAEAPPVVEDPLADAPPAPATTINDDTDDEVLPVPPLPEDDDDDDDSLPPPPPQYDDDEVPPPPPPQDDDEEEDEAPPPPPQQQQEPAPTGAPALQPGATATGNGVVTVNVTVEAPAPPPPPPRRRRARESPDDTNPRPSKKPRDDDARAATMISLAAMFGLAAAAAFLLL